jgi:hypothetical protein
MPRITLAGATGRTLLAECPGALLLFFDTRQPVVDADFVHRRANFFCAVSSRLTLAGNEGRTLLAECPGCAAAAP